MISKTVDNRQDKGEKFSLSQKSLNSLDPDTKILMVKIWDSVSAILTSTKMKRISILDQPTWNYLLATITEAIKILPKDNKNLSMQ